MIYTHLTVKAMNIAYQAHLNQYDATGAPYVLHPIHLAEQCADEDTTVVALLHDVVEDCEDYSFERLINEGIPERLVEALRFLTHVKGVPYLDYVANIKNNEIAVKVKILDLKHNMDTTRLELIQDANKRERLRTKREKYQAALASLSEML